MTLPLRSGAGCGTAESRRTRIHGAGRYACRNHRGECLGWGPAMSISCAMRPMSEAPMVPFDHDPRMDALRILLHTACWPQRSLHRDGFGRGPRRHTIRRGVDVGGRHRRTFRLYDAFTMCNPRGLRKAWLPGGAVSTDVRTSDVDATDMGRHSGSTASCQVPSRWFHITLCPADPVAEQPAQPCSPPKATTTPPHPLTIRPRFASFWRTPT